MFVTKSTLRKTVLQYRGLLSQKEFSYRNQCLLQKVREVTNTYKNIYCFLPIARNREPDLTPLFKDWWGLGKNIIVPHTDFEKKELKHMLLTRDTQLALNKKQIPEPLDAEKIDLSLAEIIFVPFLCADRLGSRIGYGGGFYDRLLLQTKAIKVGLALSPLFDKISQAEPHDCKLDQIIYHDGIHS